MNVTDVGHLVSDADEGEDKMAVGARRMGKSAWELAEYYWQAFKEDMVRLNLLEPDIWCKATDHIPEQIALVQMLETKGFTYQLDDGIYFDTSKLNDYGKLVRLDVAGLQAERGSRWGGNGNRPTSLCGNSRPATNSGIWNGIAPGESVFPAGISNVRPWP